MPATPGLRRSRQARPVDDAEACLRHVLVVGGTASEWSGTDDSRWSELLGELAHELHHAGGEWLTIRPYGGPHTAHGPHGLHRVEGCQVVVDGTADGRARVVAAVERLRQRHGAAAITEEAIAAEVIAPATVDPDLTLVLGPCDRLPPSLVWELAYTELVFTDCSWTDLGEKHLHAAIVEFTQRERRFGGLPS